MKKFLLIAAVLIMSSVSLVGCSKDENSESGSSNTMGLSGWYASVGEFYDGMEDIDNEVWNLIQIEGRNVYMYGYNSYSDSYLAEYMSGYVYGYDEKYYTVYPAKISDGMLVCRGYGFQIKVISNDKFYLGDPYDDYTTIFKKVNGFR